MGHKMSAETRRYDRDDNKIFTKDGAAIVNMLNRPPSRCQ